MSQPRLFLRSAHYTEGVVLAPDGLLYFSMTKASQICVADTRASAPSARIWAHVPGANGHAIARDGTHLVMSSTGAILRLRADGCIAKVIATEAAGTPLVYPNDLAPDEHRGGFFATDSGYKQTPAHPVDDPRGRILRVDRDDRVHVAADGIQYANGVALSPDGRTLYCTESVTRTLWSYPVDDAGHLGARRRLAEIATPEGAQAVPDGVTVAPDGTLYVAHYGAREVVVVRADGTPARRLAAGVKATSHVALGADGAHAYVSGGIEDESGPGAIFAIDLAG